GSGDDLDDLFKKRPGGGMRPFYSFEWMSELVSSFILLPGIDGRTVKKQIWDTQIVLNIKQGWNEQDIVISQELWNKIRAANLERNSGLFLALSRNPYNPEAVVDHYLNSNPAQPLPTEDYRRHTQEGFILSPKQIRSVSVIPGLVTAGNGYSTESGQAGNQMGDTDNTSPANTQFQQGSGRQNQGSGGGREGGGDDGSGGSPNRGSCRICNKPAVLGFDKCRECLAREVGLIEQELTEQERELLESGTEGADSLAIRVFEWFKTLDSNERHRGDCFRNNDYYNFPALYRLLTQSFMSNKNTLSEFYLKWVKFLNGSMSLYHLISEVGELAKSQGIEDYVEVKRIVKALAHHRHEFENETGFKKFRNDLLSILTSNNLLASDDPGHVLYSGLSRQQKVMLINYIFQTFKETSWWLKDEIFPSKFLTIIMLNQFARNVNAKYGFGIPNPYIDREELLEILTWGSERPGSGECSFITPHNRRFLIGVNSQSLHALAFNITANQFLDFHDIEAILTALAVIRSMHGQRLNDLFSKNVRFAKDVPSEQLQLLRTFTLKAREQLVKFLENKGAEEKDKFIHSMFLIFGIAPKELFDELSDQPFDELSEQPSDELSDQPADELSDPEPVQLTQAVAHAAVDPQCQQSEISRSRPLALDSDTVKMLEACSKPGLDFSPWFEKKPQSVTLDSIVTQEELLNIGSKVGVDWQKIAKKTGVLNETHIRDIDAGNAGLESKVRAMMEEWKKIKGQITYDDLLEVFSEIGRWDLMYDLNKRHKF
ncbi:death domain-containing protein, partial [Endozoicomonas sp. ONNA1]|uniref:death domain-containing protein n=1 Tax=Endozoicomonas sp. ONNA1 TaxID=2828740 RepID=UPI00214823BE